MIRPEVKAASVRPDCKDWGLIMMRTREPNEKLVVWGFGASSTPENASCVGAVLRFTADKPAMVCQHSDYRGPLKVVLINHGEENFSVRTGDRIAQAVLAAVAPFRGVMVETLEETARGEGGFGSTGITTGAADAAR